jgi:hypothetical protein
VETSPHEDLEEEGADKELTASKLSGATERIRGAINVEDSAG